MPELILDDEPVKKETISEKVSSVVKKFRIRFGISFVLFDKEFFLGLIVLNSDVLKGESSKSKTDEVKPRKGPDRIASIWILLFLKGAGSKGPLALGSFGWSL